MEQSACPQEHITKLQTVRKEVTKAATNQMEEGFTIQLWIPIALTIAYIYILKLLTQDWPQTPSTFSECSFLVPLVASASYLLLIFLGNRYMQEREALRIKNYMFTYNLYQTVLNAWCVYSFLAEILPAASGMTIWGNTLQNTSYKVSFLIWIHYNNKYVELLDTTFMVLRKKSRQISFLHVYHHVLLIWAWWLVCRFGCGGDAYFGAMMNSGVHVVMYGYYLMALLGISCPWKHYITQVQLLQFVVCLFSALYCLVRGTYPALLCFVQIYVMMNMLVLFVDFYRKNYSSRSSRSSTATQPSKLD
jgi:elongation of very long chain fatty acids protein 4